MCSNINQIMRKLILSLCILLINLNSKAQLASRQQRDSIELKALFSMSIEELMNVKVRSASKKYESIQHAPGMITSYSSLDIQKMGYYTLKELANVTSGYSTFSVFGETNLETRGQKTYSWNVSKHLILIDGIPVNHARANSAPLEYQLPLFFADQVEFMKGPGSALYGTSAFYGVMNIKSQTLINNGAYAHAKLSGGSLANDRRILVNSAIKKNDSQFQLNAGYYKRGFSGDSIGIPNSNAHYDNNNSVFLYSSYQFDEGAFKGIKVGTIYTRRSSHAGEFWGSAASPNNLLTWESIIPYIKYQCPLSRNLTLNSYLKYNSSTEKAIHSVGSGQRTLGDLPVAITGYDLTTDNWEALAELYYNFNNNNAFIAGVNFDTRKELGSPASFNHDVLAELFPSDSLVFHYLYREHGGTIRNSVFSLFSQYQHEFNVLDGLSLTLGARYDYGYSEAGKYTQLSPRVGLVQQVNQHITLKALYGQALLAPGVKENGYNMETSAYIRSSGGTGNPDDIPELNAEVIHTYEGGISLAFKNLLINSTVFHSVTSGALEFVRYSFIDKNGKTQTPSYFRNTNGEITSSGLEIELQYIPVKDLHLKLNHAYATTTIGDSIDFYNVPTHKTNAIITYSFPQKLKLTTTLIGRRVWGFMVPANTYDHPSLDISSDNILSGYSVWDLNLILHINQQVSLEAQCKNLFNHHWKQPSLLGQSSMIPIHSRHFFVTLSLRL